jgi:hypothetical protein
MAHQEGHLIPLALLHPLEANSSGPYRLFHVQTGQHAALHGCRDRRANQTIEPVVVRLLGPLFPFVYASAAGFRLDEVLRGQMLGEHAMCLCIAAKERKATAIAHRDTKASIDERLPPVGIVDHMTYRSLTVDVWDTPIESYAITWAATILAKRQTRCAHEPTVAGDYHCGVLGLPAELVNHICRLPPIGIDQTATDTHRSPIVSLPFAIE